MPTSGVGAAPGKEAGVIVNDCRANPAPKERRIVAAGGAKTAKQSKRNPWIVVYFDFRPGGAAESMDTLTFGSAWQPADCRVDDPTYAMMIHFEAP